MMKRRNRELLCSVISLSILPCSCSKHLVVMPKRRVAEHVGQSITWNMDMMSTYSTTQGMAVAMEVHPGMIHPPPNSVMAFWGH